MSDESVSNTLRSKVPLVVVEAPAGCGKTHQGAEYARELAKIPTGPRPLILTHTHAAISVFAERTKGLARRIEIRTVDSQISEIAQIYHKSLGLPSNIFSWLQRRKEGHRELAQMVSRLMQQRPMIARAIVQRHAVLICDEHQDTNSDQHTIVEALLCAGAQTRIFADPMQCVFPESAVIDPSSEGHWDTLTAKADYHVALENPHRWKSGCLDLGQWTLRARETLKAGGRIDLRNRPPSVSVIVLENRAERNMQYRVDGQDRRPVDHFVDQQTSLLILTPFNDTANALRSFFARRISLWEGHARPALESLVAALEVNEGKPDEVAQAFIDFVSSVGKGFSQRTFGDILLREISGNCTQSRRGKTVLIQNISRLILSEPSHRGAAKALRYLWGLKQSEEAFASIEVDGVQEYWDAVRLQEFDTPSLGFSHLTTRRTHGRRKPPSKAISTIHKAKGLECDSVLLLPCDGKTFPNTSKARSLLYVALSRAKKRLLLVVSREHPSPLLEI
jgi:UvrD-like helicase C-terminal domain/AAA domain